MIKRITSKDVEAFGRVLEALGQLLQSKPGALLSLLTEDRGEPDSHDNADAEVDTAKMDTFSLFDAAKGNDGQELANQLTGFSYNELRYLVKRYHLGGTRLRSKDQLVHYIVQQATKRMTDVFREHQSLNLNRDL